MLTKEEYVSQMQAKLDEWSAEIDELEAKARKKQAQATQGYNERFLNYELRRTRCLSS